ncbi:MFS transporter [Nocardia sp. NEAU-351]|uniref:MFS transporter n=1 Tax=Nocardia bovistercoris TaxID=2785916 RepID=A0A931I932_9NOCA|nr:MFS transporter [Nocardia bovistercoris]
MRSQSPTVRPNVVLAVLASAGIVAALMQTLVVPLLGQLPDLLHSTASTTTWVVTATLLVGAVVTPVAGRLGDMYGKRPILLASIVPLVLGSVVCALASSVLPMIIGRGLQGMGVGIIPLGISAIRDLVPPERLGSAIALISASLGIGGALGLPIAAAVVENSDWRVLFWGSAVLAAAVGVLMYLTLPVVPADGPAGRFDALGALGLGVALVCLLLAVSKGATWGWTSATILGLFAAAVATALVWGRWELRRTHPLVDLRVTARPRVLLTNATSVVVAMAMYAQSLIIPQLLQLPKSTGYGLGQSMLAMGLWMAPAGLTMMVISPFGARLSAARGPKVTLGVGCVVIAAGYASSMPLMGSTWGLLAVTVLINIGVGFAYGAMPALIMGAVPHSETAAANSFNTLMRAVGTSISAAVVGAVLAQLSVTANGHLVPTENGFRIGLLLGCAVAALGAALSATIPADRPGPSVPDPGPDSASDDVVGGGTYPTAPVAAFTSAPPGVGR